MSGKSFSHCPAAYFLIVGRSTKSEARPGKECGAEADVDWQN